MEDYLEMIGQKTSVLLAASLQMGAIVGGASENNQHHMYEFGRNLGIAFQIQDDYLDAFGDPEKFGKQVGGDIKSNKKTFLMIHALETASGVQLEKLEKAIKENPDNKVEQVLEVFKACGIDSWAAELKEQYLQKALKNLDDVAVSKIRKEPLLALANFLITRDK